MTSKMPTQHNRPGRFSGQLHREECARTATRCCRASGDGLASLEGTPLLPHSSAPAVARTVGWRPEPSNHDLLMSSSLNFRQVALFQERRRSALDFWMASSEEKAHQNQPTSSPLKRASHVLTARNEGMCILENGWIVVGPAAQQHGQLTSRHGSGASLLVRKSIQRHKDTKALSAGTRLISHAKLRCLPASSMFCRWN